MKEAKKKAREEKKEAGQEGTGQAAGARARQAMSRILLVDDSPHAQRMGERILSEEGYEVVTVSNADSALIRLDDVDPDLVLADTVMPGRTGYEICQYLKMSPRHRHVRVILTAGVMETLDEAAVARVEADATLRKPFEASALLAAVKPLAELAAQARTELSPAAAGTPRLQPTAAAPFIAVIDEEQVRAAVTVALDASMAVMVDEIARRVTAALATRKSDSTPVQAPAPMAAAVSAAGPIPAPPPATIPAIAPPPKAAPPVPAAPLLEPVRRVNPRSPSLRFYSRIRYQPVGARILRPGPRLTYARQQLRRSIQDRDA